MPDFKLGGCAVIAAAANGHADVLHALLADGRADLTRYGRAALFEAASHGHLAAVDVLMADHRILSIEEAVVAAAAGGHGDILDRLLADPRIDFPLNDGWAVEALRAAAAAGHVTVVARFLRAPLCEKLSLKGWWAASALRAAAAHGHVAVVDEMIKLGVDPTVRAPHTFPGCRPINSPMGTPLFDACKYGHVAVVERLLADPRVDPAAPQVDDTPYCALHVAATFGQLAVVERLLADSRVDVAADFDGVLAEAAAHGHALVVDRLLRDPRVDCSADYFIHDAAINGHVAVIARLLADPRVDVDAGMKGAAVGGSADVAELLLADPRYRPECGLEEAVRCGHAEIVRLILDHPRLSATAASDIDGALIAAAGSFKAVHGRLQLQLEAAARTGNRPEVAPRAGTAGLMAQATGTCRQQAEQAAHEIVSMLLAQPRVDPAAYGGMALSGALLAGNSSMVMVLLQDGRAGPFPGILREAAEHCDAALMSCLLADPRVRDIVVMDSAEALNNAMRRLHKLTLRQTAKAAAQSRRPLADPMSRRDNGDDAVPVARSVLDALLMDSRVVSCAKGWLQLRLASMVGVLPLVERLLAQPTSVTDPSTRNCLAFHEAAEAGHAAIVGCFLADSRVDPAAAKNAALISAAGAGHTAVVELLLADARVRASSPEHATLCAAAMRGQLAVVEMLLADGRVDAGAVEQLALMYAAQSGHVAVVDRLLADPRVDPSARANEALNSAAGSGHLSVVQRLLADSRVQPACNDNAALQAAVHRPAFAVSRHVSAGCASVAAHLVSTVPEVRWGLQQGTALVSDVLGALTVSVSGASDALNRRALPAPVLTAVAQHLAMQARLEPLTSDVKLQVRRLVSPPDLAEAAWARRGAAVLARAAAWSAK